MLRFVPGTPFTSLIKASATPSIRLRGQGMKDEVCELAINRGLVTAVVGDEARGDAYEVVLEAIGGSGVTIKCACQEFTRSRCCAHHWALALALDEEVSEDPKLLFKFAGGAIFTGTQLAAAQEKKKQQPDKTPAWQAFADALRRDVSYAHPPAVHVVRSVLTPGTRIVYRLDADSYHDQLMLTVCQECPKRKGGWQLKQANSEQWASSTDPDDITIRGALLSRGVRDGRYYESGINVPLSTQAFEHTVKPMIATGRARVTLPRTASMQRIVPATWDADVAYEVVLRGKLDAEDRFRVSAHLDRGDRSIDPRELVRTFDHYHLTKDGAFIRVDGQPAAFFNLIRSRFPAIVPRADARAFHVALLKIPGLPPIELPDGLAMRTVTHSPSPRLHVKRHAYNDRTLVGTVEFAYGAHTINADDARRSIVVDAEHEPFVIPRQISAEAGCLEHIASLKLRSDSSSSPGSYQIPAGQLIDVVLHLRDRGWHVEADGKLYRSARSIDIKVSSGIDWFDVRGNASFDGINVPLPRILEALRTGQKSIVLDDGTIGLLPEAWLRKYGGLGVAGDVEGDSVRFKPTQAALLDVLLSKLPEVDVDQRFSDMRQRLDAFKQVEPVEAPDTFVGTLRPYQREGLGWLHYLNRFGFGGCLADDMGLGKTIQVLALLESRRAQGAGPSLVVAPRSLIFNWKNEAAKFTPKMRVLDFSEPGRKKSTDHLSDYDLILTTYALLRTDAALLQDVTFDYAILDEAQAIKNASTASAKAARLIQARHRLAMTGTPIENHLGELWSLFDFLNPGMFGAGSGFKVLAGSNAGNDATQERALISRTIRPFILRRTKKQVASDLPDRIEQTVYCELEPKQRKIYDELREHYRASLLKSVETEGINKAQIQILQALLRLRQAACSTALIDPKHAHVPSAKIDTLIDRLIEAADEGHKVLVFSQFTSLLALVRKELVAKEMNYEYLDGQTRDRQAKVQRFQSDEKCPVFLISLKAGGVGLNLTAADYVFLLDPWWNPAAEAQAIDRTHRIGQHRTVMAYRLIAKDTVEEKVLELQRTKRELADAIIGDADEVSAAVTREDLELLLS